MGGKIIRNQVLEEDSSDGRID